MKALFSILALTFALTAAAEVTAPVMVGTYATMGDDFEALLDIKAANVCERMVAKRVSEIHSTLLPNHYGLMIISAQYVCMQ